jgi:hypothetical protein
MRRTRSLLLFGVCAILATTLSAQVVITSNIVGTVTDPQGAVIPDANVTLRNLDTGVQRKVTTSESGDYRFPNLIAGHYKVEVLKQGFAKAMSTTVALENGTTQRVNIALKMGQTEEVVEVIAAATLVKTDDTSVSEVIQNRLVRDLPIEGRNFLNYAQIVPMFNSGSGDTTRVDWGLASATAPPGSKQLNVGGTEYGVGYYIDGLNNNDNWVEGPMMNVNMDAVQEVKAEVVNYSAEYGRDVGQISLTTKSGTNSLHGTVYDFFQNAGLNANDPYSKVYGTERAPYHQNQYGFTVGGPVYIPKVFNGKNKMFFFASFEQFRNRGQNPFHAYVPTADERTGDFSEWLTRFPGDPRYVIYDPYSFNPATQTRQAYTNNIIPNPDPKAIEYLSHFPIPNFTSPVEGDFSNYSGRTTNGIDGNNYSARIDYNFSAGDNVSFRYSYDYGTKINEGGLIPELALGNGPVHTVRTYQWHWVHAFGPRLNNEFNFSLTRGHNSNEQASGINKYMQTTWFSDLFKNVSSAGGGFTQYDLDQLGIKDDGIFALQFAGGLFGPLSMGPDEYWYQAIPVYQLADNVAKTIGRHTLKFGFNWSRRDERDNDVIRSVTIGGWCPGTWGCENESLYTASSPLAGDGSGWNTLAEFETGAVFTMNQRTPLSSGDGSLWFRMPEYAAYFNDVWNVNPKLTLNYGLRYDVGVPAFSVDNYWGVLDKGYPGYRLVMPGLTPGTSAKPYPADKNNFAPRFGFAYRPFDKTVIRGGYGIFFETGRFKFLDQVFWNSPGYGGATYTSPDYAGINGMDPNQVYFSLNDVFPVPTTVEKGNWPIPLGDKGGELYPRQDATTIDEQSPVTAYLQRWSLDIQRELGSKAVLTLGYVGSKGTKLTMADDLNLPPQGVYLDDESFYQARPLSSQYQDRWGSILAVHHDRNNNYNAFNAQLKTQGWHGLTSAIAYTFSKQLDTYFGQGGYDNYTALGGQWHREWSYAESDANHPHRLVAAVTYELPGRNLGSRILREAVGGWQINTIATFESGSRVTVWNGDTSSYDYMGDVPDRVCSGNLSGGDRTFTHYFDTSCFVNPPSISPDTNIATHRGNSGRNILRGPGINNWDMSLSKAFRTFGEGRELQVRAEAFNVFNHTQWSSINTWNDTGTNSESQFGYITGSRPGRHMQFAVKFVF